MCRHCWKKKATIPLFETLTISGSFRSESYYYIANVSDQTVAVSINFYDGNSGAVIPDDGTATGGRIYSEFFVGQNYNDANGVQFSIAPRRTVRIHVADNGPYQIGHGEISWSSTSPVSGGKALVASGQVYNVFGEKQYSRLININSGLPF